MSSNEQQPAVTSGYWNVTHRGVDHLLRVGQRDERALCGKLPPKELRCWCYRTPYRGETMQLCKRCLARMRELEGDK